MCTTERSIIAQTHARTFCISSPVETMTTTPIPFYVLCGSLGAGKTTLLMRLLEHWKSQGKRAGVLMNEAGEVSIDGPRAGTIAEQVMNLAGGCVCCDTKEDLSWGIAQLVRDYESDVIILECSGMADPAEVIDGVTDLYTARLTHLEKVIALLHPIPTDRESMGGFVTRQAIRCADELILNKRDLYIPGHWEAIHGLDHRAESLRACLGNQPCPSRSLIAARTNHPHVADADGECGIRRAAIIRNEQAGIVSSYSHNGSAARSVEL